MVLYMKTARRNADQLIRSRYPEEDSGDGANGWMIGAAYPYEIHNYHFGGHSGPGTDIASTIESTKTNPQGILAALYGLSGNLSKYACLTIQSFMYNVPDNEQSAVPAQQTGSFDSLLTLMDHIAPNAKRYKVHPGNTVEKKPRADICPERLCAAIPPVGRQILTERDFVSKRCGQDRSSVV